MGAIARRGAVGILMILLTVLHSQGVWSQTTGRTPITVTTNFVSMTTSGMKISSPMTTAGDVCLGSKYNDCRCRFTPYFASLSSPISRFTRCLWIALFGIPVGLALSLLTYGLFLCCYRGKQDSKKYEKAKKAGKDGCTRHQNPNTTQG